MNRPKITKQTLKELRGELLSKQNAQRQESSSNLPQNTQLVDDTANSNENRVEQELGDELGM